jgi:hypothetical protein
LHPYLYFCDFLSDNLPAYLTDFSIAFLNPESDPFPYLQYDFITNLHVFLQVVDGEKHFCALGTLENLALLLSRLHQAIQRGQRLAARSR